MLKAPPLKSSDLHFSITNCHCQTYDDNIGYDWKKLSSAILGVYNIKVQYLYDIMIARQPAAISIAWNHPFGFKFFDYIAS